MPVAELRSDLQSSRARLFAPLRGLNEEQFRQVAVGSDWSIATHLAHLLRLERLYGERALRALREDEPQVPSMGTTNDDEPASAQQLAVPQIIHGLQATRRALDELLASCDERMLARVVVHEHRGRLSVWEMATKIIAHEGEHAEAVARLAAEVPATRRVIIPLRERG
ncbi:MAG: DinB family protein [Dehalococcoidia bacterium]|nr:DinB family protein [Dehalococcoidia bacterium]